MSNKETTSKDIAKLASKYIKVQVEDISHLNKMEYLTLVKDMRSMAASLLTQCKDKDEYI